MEKKSLILLIVVLAVLFPSSNSLFAQKLYSHQQATEILAQESVNRELNHFSSIDSSDQITLIVKRWLEMPDQNALLKEKLLYQSTLILRSRPVDPTLIQNMEQLVNYESLAKIPLNDNGYSINIVAFEVAASAKATLLHWEINEVFHLASVELANKPLIFLDHLSQSNSDQVKLNGYMKAINQAEIQPLKTLTTALKLNAIKVPSKALIVLGNRTADPELFHQLINQYQYQPKTQAQVINSLSNLPDAFDNNSKIKLLFNAAKNQYLADTAVHQMSHYVDSDLNIQSFLLEKLSDRKLGGTAALSLSKSKDLLTIEVLASNLKSSNSLLVKRSLLSLYFILLNNPSHQAKLVLSSFRDTTTDQQLRREVSQWLK